MISHTTDLKVSLYSAAILTSAAFVQREASIYGTFFAIVLALGRSLARALCRLLPERRSKFVSNNHSHALIPVTRYSSAVICIFYVLFFCIKAHAQTAIDEPFGLSTIPAAQTAIGATWKELLSEITNDLSIIDNCRENPQSCSSLAAIKFVSIAKAGERHEGLARIGHLNQAANLAIRTLNSAPSDDKWRSPLAILSSGTGDCKHYAVLKYAMLKELGVSPDVLKILVVEVRSIHQQHAILAVRTEKGRWLLLDNRTLMLVESSMALDYYDPLYELDQNGVRLFASSLRSPQLAQSPPLTQTR